MIWTIVFIAIFIVLIGVVFYNFGQIKMRKKIINAVKEKKLCGYETIDVEHLDAFSIDMHDSYLGGILGLILGTLYLFGIIFASYSETRTKYTNVVIDDYKNGKYEMVDTYKETYSPADSLLIREITNHTYKKKGEK